MCVLLPPVADIHRRADVSLQQFSLRSFRDPARDCDRHPVGKLLAARLFQVTNLAQETVLTTLLDFI